MFEFIKLWGNNDSQQVIFPSVDMAQHHRIRKVLKRHQMAASRRLSTDLVRRTAKKFGLMRAGELVASCETELVLLFDFLLYSFYQRGRTAMETYLAKQPATDDPLERIVLSAMAKNHFSLFEIQQVKRGTGVWMYDLIHEKDYPVVDEGLSISGRHGGLLAYRLLQLPEYSMTSGAGVPIDEAVRGEMLNLFQKRLHDSGASSQQKAQTEQHFAQAVISAAIEQGLTDRMAFIR